MVILISCNNVTTPENSQTNFKYENSGEIHNEVCAFVMENKVKGEHLTIGQIIEGVRMFGEENNYSEEFINSSIDCTISKFIELNIITVVNGEFTFKENAEINPLDFWYSIRPNLNDFEIEKLEGVVLQICNNEISAEEAHQLMIELDQTLKNFDYELAYKCLMMIDVYLHSDDFWFEDNNKLSRDSTIILIDFICSECCGPLAGAVGSCIAAEYVK